MTNVFVVTGTDTGVGKTVVTAAWAAAAAAAGERVAVVKLAQTGTRDGDSDIAEIRRLSGLPAEAVVQFADYPEPLAPATAARRVGWPPLPMEDAAAALRDWSRSYDRVLVEGAGGLLVPFADSPAWNLADLAAELDAPALVVARAGLGTLNHTALTLEALTNRFVSRWGVVIGAWPAVPGLAERTNLADLQAIPGATLAGALPAGAGAVVEPETFLAVARAGLAPVLGGGFDAADFTARNAPEPKAAE
jgi:dethiobiotin synthetase